MKLLGLCATTLLSVSTCERQLSEIGWKSDPSLWPETSKATIASVVVAAAAEASESESWSVKKKNKRAKTAKKKKSNVNG